MSWSIEYGDGSANVYRFTADGDGATFAYEPVTPERSSTGMYSGGPPRAGRLDAAAVAALWRLVRAFEDNRAAHVADRGKGTGRFHITEGDATWSFIVARGAELGQFDAHLAAL